MVQIIYYNELLDNFVEALKVANTTTAAYDLSTGLDERIKTITRSDMDVAPTFKPSYPVVNLKLANKSEEIEGDIATQNYNKIVDVYLEIECIYEAYSKAEDNLWRMITNIEAITRYNDAFMIYNANGFKIMYTLPRVAQFKHNYGKESAYNKSARIEILIRGHLKDS